MPAPTGSDGLGRAVEEVLVPPVGVLVVVVFTREFVGPVVAGLVYLVLTGIVLLGLYSSATHWNTRYTAGFVLAGVVLFGLAPSIVSQLVHPVFGFLGQLLFVVILALIGWQLIEKAGLDDLVD